MTVSPDPATRGNAACPTSCDADCDAGCHEWHQPRWKRDHDPLDCPGNVEVMRCPTCQRDANEYDDPAFGLILRAFLPAPVAWQTADGRVHIHSPNGAGVPTFAGQPMEPCHA